MSRRRRDLTENDAKLLITRFEQAASSGKVPHLKQAVQSAIRIDRETSSDIITALSAHSGLRAGTVRSYPLTTSGNGLHGRIRDGLLGAAGSLRENFGLTDHDSRLPSPPARYARVEVEPKLPNSLRMAAAHRHS